LTIYFARIEALIKVSGRRVSHNRIGVCQFGLCNIIYRVGCCYTMRGFILLI
jgi:predicted metal-binding membrane protein